MKPILSICVAVYNIRGDFLRECLASVTADRSEDIEIIIGDDCSREDCAVICREYAAADSRIKYIRPEKNGGVSVMRNMMIEAAEGGLLTFVDGDDVVPGDYVSKIRGAVGYDIVMFEVAGFSDRVPGIINLDAKAAAISQQACRDFSAACLTGAPGHIERYGIKNSTPSSVCNKIFRRDFLIENGLRFVAGLRKSQDTVFNTSAYYHCTSLGYLPCTLYYYRKNPTSICNRYSADFDAIMSDCFECDRENLAKLYNNDEEMRKKLYKYKLIWIIVDNFRLNIFHADNPKSRRKRRADFQRFIGSEPYRSFFADFDFENYEWRERRLILRLAKHKKFAVLDFMYRHPQSFRLYGGAANRLARLAKRGKGQ